MLHYRPCAMCWPCALVVSAVVHASCVHECGAMVFHAICSHYLIKVPWESCPLCLSFLFTSGGEWHGLFFTRVALWSQAGEKQELWLDVRGGLSTWPSRKALGIPSSATLPYLFPYICPSPTALTLPFPLSQNWAFSCYHTTFDSALELDHPPQTEDQSPTPTITGVSGASPPLSLFGQPDLGSRLLTSSPGGTTYKDRHFKVLKLSL